MDYLSSGFSLSARSPSHMALLVLALDFLHLEPSSPIQSFGRFGSTSSLRSFAHVDLASSLSGLCQLDFSLSTLDGCTPGKLAVGSKL